MEVVPILACAYRTDVPASDHSIQLASIIVDIVASSLKMLLELILFDKLRGYLNEWTNERMIRQRTRNNEKGSSKKVISISFIIIMISVSSSFLGECRLFLYNDDLLRNREIGGSGWWGFIIITTFIIDFIIISIFLHVAIIDVRRSQKKKLETGRPASFKPSWSADRE